MNFRLRQWLVIYQYVAGICDSGAGLLIIGFPVFTLGLMRITVIPLPLAFIRYIGVFVLCVGLTYLWTAIRWPLTESTALVWLTQWKITAFIRAMVALFLLWQWIVHGVEAGWGTVMVFDGVFAAIQFIGLEQGWIERAA